MKLALIVATARNRVIGRNNQLPWHLPQDLKYFKSVTLGKPVIMGRKTFESIGRPLPGRINIVITRQSTWASEGVLTAGDLPSALAFAEAARARGETGSDEVMIIGGAEIYATGLPLAQRIYLTRIDTDVEGGDAFFPALDESEWRQISATAGAADAPLAHEFLVFERIDQ